MIPYEVIGFAVFWVVVPIVVLSVGFASLAYLRKLLLNKLQIIDKSCGVRQITTKVNLQTDGGTGLVSTTIF